MRQFGKDSGAAKSKTVDLTKNPSPTIQAGGLGGIGLGQFNITDKPSYRERNTDKPLYKIPSMVDIAMGRKEFKVVSTFSGCGGSSLGYHMAGFKIVWANEMEPNAAKTYRLNFPDSIIDQRDIRDIDPQEILRAINMKPRELDLLDGSPPCQSFSTAGKREKYWGKKTKHADGTYQKSDDLFFQYTRLLKGLQPKVFIAENVSGLVKGVAKGYFKNILHELKACGYTVEARLLDAQWLGVPQTRQRIIFIGVRHDLADRCHVGPKFPQPLPYRYSVVDAIGNLVNGSKIQLRIATGFGKEKMVRGTGRPSPTIGTSTGFGNNFNNGSSTIRFIEDTKGQQDVGDFTGKPSPTVRSGRSGGLWIQNGGNPKKYKNIKYPSPAVMAGRTTEIKSNTVRRKFTIAEVKRICAFPDDFILIGSYSQQWARLGNSVPPLMMKAIAEVVRDEMLAKIPRRK